MNNKLFIAGVSGGPDSMALLDIYKKYIKAVCFVNYFDRDDTYIDESIVKKYCDENNIIFHGLNCTKEIFNEFKKNNFQNNCRIIRYDFYCEIAKKYNIKHILIGHNLNDFIESCYQQIDKNKKPMFFGIKKISSYKDIVILRPLIDIQKSNLMNYCRKHNIQYIIDSTNSKNIYERNIHRKYINKLSNDEINNFVNLINRFNNSNKNIEKFINEKFNIWKLKSFDLNFINYNNKNVKYQLLYLFLSKYYVAKISKNKIENLLDFISSNKNDKMYRISSNVFLSKKNNKLNLETI